LTGAPASRYQERMRKPIISADSHVTEPPDTYLERIDARFRDRAPRLVRDDARGDLFVIEGLDKPIPMGLIAAAGKPAETLRCSAPGSRTCAGAAGTPRRAWPTRSATASARR
jgi:hypothetical protein